MSKNNQSNNVIILILIALLIFSSIMIYRAYFMHPDINYKEQLKTVVSEYEALSVYVIEKENQLLEFNKNLVNQQLLIDSLLIEINSLQLNIEQYDEDVNSIINLPIDGSIKLLSKNLSTKDNN